MTGDIAQLFTQAEAALAQGNLNAAETLYRRILDQDQRHHQSSHGLAQIALAYGRLDVALAMADQAIAVDAGIGVYHGLRAHVLERLGHLPDAAIGYQRALTLDPRYGAFHANLGLVLGRLGRLGEAVASLQRALAIAPNDVAVTYNLGFAYEGLGQFSDALVQYDRAVALDPAFAGGWTSRGKMLFALNRVEESLAAVDRALALNPNNADAHNNRGSALSELHRLADAVASYDRALAIAPSHVSAVVNRGNALQRLGRLDEALAHFTRAQTLNPSFARAHLAEGICRLQMNDLPKGWEKYEYRWRVRPETVRRFPSSLWLGAEELEGKRILIYGEQGFGDCIQFSRYVPMVAALGAHVVLDVPRALVRLMTSLDGVAELHAEGDSLPSTDFHCPLASLPLAFKTSPQTIPAAAPYLAVPDDVGAKWRKRLADVPRPRIGLNWIAGARYQGDLHRSMAPDLLSPLLQCGATLVSLQDRYRPEDRDWLNANPAVRDFSAEIEDFADTAAIAREMDLVISVDTAVAHLAGALGLQLWILLSYIGDWRWLSDREDTPWYPTAKLYRQTDTNDWTGVIARVARDLAQKHGMTCSQST